MGDILYITQDFQGDIYKKNSIQELRGVPTAVLLYNCVY